MAKLTKKQIADISSAIIIKDFNWLARIAKEIGKPVEQIQNAVAIQCELKNVQNKMFNELAEPIMFNDERLKPYKVTLSLILSKVVVGEQKKQRVAQTPVNPKTIKCSEDVFVPSSHGVPGQTISGSSIKGSIADSFGIPANTEEPIRKKENKTKKGSVNMFNKLFGGQDLMGKVEGVGLALMSQQLAVPVGDKYFTFDKTSKTISDVTSLVAEINLPAYKFPTLTSAVVEGDLIEFDGQLVFVTEVTANGRIIGTNPVTSKEETFSPVPVAMLGNQTFVAKIQTFDLGFGKAGDASNPMANLMPLMLLSEGGLGGNSDIDPMMIMALSGGFGGAQDGSNPMANMLPLMLLGDKKSGSSDIDPMLLMMMMGGQNPLGNLFGGAPATVPAVDTEKEELKEEVAKLTAALNEVTK